MTQPPPMPNELPKTLAYARVEDTGLAAAYRLVGWFFLAAALSAGINSGISIFDTMSSVAELPWLLMQYAVTALPRVIPIIGAVGMIRTRAWGAIVVAITYTLGICLPVIFLLYLSAARGVGGGSLPSGIVSALLSSAVFALLPLGMWRICRAKGVLR